MDTHDMNNLLAQLTAILNSHNEDAKDAVTFLIQTAYQQLMTPSGDGDDSSDRGTAVKADE